MVSAVNIYKFAQILIEEHGREAEAYAEAHLQAMIDDDDVKGASVWLSIMAAIDDLSELRAKGPLH